MSEGSSNFLVCVQPSIGDARAELDAENASTGPIDESWKEIGRRRAPVRPVDAWRREMAPRPPSPVVTKGVGRKIVLDDVCSAVSAIIKSCRGRVVGGSRGGRGDGARSSR